MPEPLYILDEAPDCVSFFIAAFLRDDVSEERLRRGVLGDKDLDLHLVPFGELLPGDTVKIGRAHV